MRNLSSLPRLKTAKNYHKHTRSHTPGRLLPSRNFHSKFYKSPLEAGLNIPPFANKSKVLELRRTIMEQLEGFTRNQIKDLFCKLDRQNQGALTAAEIIRGLNLDTNLEDMRNLVLSVSEHNVPGLFYPEFVKLIEKKPACLNIDLLYQKNARSSGNLRKYQGNLKQFLVTHKEELRFEFAKLDRDNTGKVNFEQFLQVINNVEVPYKYINALNLKILYCENGGSDFLDYSLFLENFDIENKKFYKNSNEDHIVKSLIRAKIGSKDNLIKELIINFGLKAHQSQVFHYIRHVYSDLNEELVTGIEFDSNGYVQVGLFCDWVFDRSHDKVHSNMLKVLEERTRLKNLLKSINWNIVKVYGFCFFGKLASINIENLQEVLSLLKISSSLEDLHRLFGDTEIKSIQDFKALFQRKMKEYCPVHRKSLINVGRKSPIALLKTAKV